jgi:hypothetical protein
MLRYARKVSLICLLKWQDRFIKYHSGGIGSD